MSLIINNVQSEFQISENDTHSTPATGKVAFYAKTDGNLYQKDDTGSETQLSGGGTSAPAGEIVYGTGGSVTSDPIFNYSPIYGYHATFFNSAKTGTDPTGLANDATVYTAAVEVDGGVSQPIAVTGQDAQDFDELLFELNTDTIGATWAIDIDGFVRCTSDTPGSTSAVYITDTDLFSSLTDFSFMNIPVGGLSLLNITASTSLTPGAAGGYVQLSGGNGGDDAAGGAIVFTGGTGGTSTTSLGVGGGISILAGGGGSGGGFGSNGGSILITAGTAGSGTSGVSLGGDIDINGGTPTGSITINAGNGHDAASGESANVGGSFSANCGNGGTDITQPDDVNTNAGNGASLDLSPGDGGNATSNDGGAAPTATAGDGGSFTLFCGNGGTGYVQASGGPGDGNSNGGLGGSITLQAGGGGDASLDNTGNAAAGDGGSVNVTAGPSGIATGGTPIPGTPGNINQTTFAGYWTMSAGNFSGAFATTKLFVLRAQTTAAATPIEMTRNNDPTTNPLRMVLPVDSAWKYEIHIIGQNTTTLGEAAAYQWAGAIINDGGTTSLVAPAEQVMTAQDTITGGTNVTVSADNTNDALVVEVTATTSGNDINWVAFVTIVEASLNAV